MPLRLGGRGDNVQPDSLPARLPGSTFKSLPRVDLGSAPPSTHAWLRGDGWNPRAHVVDRGARYPWRFHGAAEQSCPSVAAIDGPMPVSVKIGGRAPRASRRLRRRRRRCAGREEGGEATAPSRSQVTSVSARQPSRAQPREKFSAGARRRVRVGDPCRGIRRHSHRVRRTVLATFYRVFLSARHRFADSPTVAGKFRLVYLWGKVPAQVK